MSEMMGVEVRVLFPASWLTRDGEPYRPEFLDQLTDAIGDGYFQSAEQPVDGVCDWLAQGEGNYGLADSNIAYALERLRELRVPFWAADDPKYELSGSWTLFDGTTEIGGTKGGEDILLDRSEYADIRAGNHWAATVDDYFNPPWLGDCSLEHLPAEYPREEE